MLSCNGWWTCVHNFKSICSKMAELWHKTRIKTVTFQVISRLYHDYPNFIFWPILTLQKALMVIVMFFAKIWPKHMYGGSLFRFLYLFYLVTWGDLDLYYGHNAQEMVRMSEALSTPIHWHYLRLTSKFCSPMSPSRNRRTFRLRPDLWRHQWTLGKISHHVWEVHVQGYRTVFEFRKSVP